VPCRRHTNLCQLVANDPWLGPPGAMASHVQPKKTAVVSPYPYYRVIAELGRDGQFHFTETNAFSGDNGRAAILNEAAGLFYAAGNAGNGSNPEPNGVVLGAGAQLVQPSDLPEAAQDPSTTPTPVGSFNINQLGDAVDKSAKDDNFQGITVYGNVLYFTKGSGGNGIDSVYFVDTTGKACPTGGVGLPQASTSASRTLCPATRPASTPLPPEGLDCRGRPPLPAYATSPAGSTRTAPPPSGPSPRRSVAAVTRARTPTSSSA
jgi:hypothetical protein